MFYSSFLTIAQWPPGVTFLISSLIFYKFYQVFPITTLDISHHLQAFIEYFSQQSFKISQLYYLNIFISVIVLFTIRFHHNYFHY